MVKNNFLFVKHLIAPLLIHWNGFKQISYSVLYNIEKENIVINKNNSIATILNYMITICTTNVAFFESNY